MCVYPYMYTSTCIRIGARPRTGRFVRPEPCSHAAATGHINIYMYIYIYIYIDVSMHVYICK